MVFSCCAFGCTNRQGKIGIKFYRFPSDPERRSKWIAAIKRQNWTPSEYSRLCSAHFILGEQCKNPLHPDYVPSVFVFSDSGECTSNENFDRFRRGILRSRNKSLNTNAKRYKRDSLRNGQDEEVTEDSTLLESEQLQQEVEDEAPAYEDKEPTDEEEPIFDEEPVYNDNEQTDDDKGEEPEYEDEDPTNKQEEPKESEYEDCELEELELEEELEELEYEDQEVEELELEEESEESEYEDQEPEEEELEESEYEDLELAYEEEPMYDGEPGCDDEGPTGDDELAYDKEGFRVSDINLELESKEIALGEYEIENTLLQQKLDSCESENRSLKDRVRILENENALLKVILSRSQWHNFGSHRAIVSLRSNNEILQSKLERQSFGASCIKDSDSKTCFYTGLITYQIFLTLFLQLQQCFKTTVSKLELIDEFFITLVKLRLGVPHRDLAYRMDVDEKYIGLIFRRWIDIMSVELKCLVAWPDKEALVHNMPSTFQKHYINTRCIIDCFEIFIQRPTSFLARAQTYSQYKRHNTVKVLIGVAPTGSICFISEAWGGRVSDKVITQQSGFLQKVEFGDDIMADRGFNIGDDLAVSGARLLIPAFTKGKEQLSAREVETTRRLARVRIHVERVIGHLRKKYKILQQTLPINMIKLSSDNEKKNCFIDRILIVTAALTNLSPSVVKK